MLSLERARELLRYDESTGDIFWRVARGRVKRGDEAGQIGKRNGCFYRYIRVDGELICAHRLAWLLSFGAWPDGVIDHIDGNGLNNRLGNLRDVTQAENRRNSRRYSTNSSGVPGVHWKRANRKWCARISIEGKWVWIGLFDTLAEAARARGAAELRHGYHANHGRIAA